MAGKGSVNIKIGGDASAYQKELNESVKATEAAAAKIDGALSDAAKSLSDGLADSFKSAQKEQSTAVKNISKSVNTIVGQNNELISQKSEMGDIYDKLGEGAKAASVKVKAGLADIKAGIDMAAAAARKLGEIAATGVNYNATIESMKTSFEVMTGSAEKAAEVVDRLRKMGAETPFEMTDLTSTTQLLMQYGFTADDAIDKMSMLGDIAQGNSEAMTSIAMGYAQMSSAGKVNLQDIKQMINGGFNPLQEISERTGESMASLYDRISKGKMTIDEITQSMVHSTSEGGKFFQSMEKQSKTLNGQLSTLKDNANQLLGTLTSGMSDGLRDELLPLANNMIGELQSAFESGGMDSLVTTATDMIPDLLGMMTGKIEDAISGVTRWLPQGASKIMAAFPAALKSTTAIVPQLTTAFFDVASVVVTDLVSMLPELTPVLLDGLQDMAGAVLEGAGSLVEALFVGVEQAFHQGQRKIAGVWVDSEQVAEISAVLETDIDLGDAESEIETAYSEVRNALKTDLLTDKQKTEIMDMIGSDYDDVKAKLLSFGLTEEEAAPIADAVATAGDTLVEAYKGLDVGIDPVTLAKLTIQANGSRLKLRSLLKKAGLKDSDIAQVVGVYTEMTGKVAEQTPSIIEEIYDKLTDGKPDDDQTVASLKEKITGYVDGLLSDLESAYAAKSAELDTTAADYNDKKAALDAWYESTKTEINAMNTDMTTLVDTLAGAPTAVVQARMDDLAEMEQTLAGIEDRINEVAGKARSAAENAFSVVRSGANADEATIGTAINFKVTEFKLDEQAADDAYNAAIEQLNADLVSGKITKEEFNAQVESKQLERDAAKQTAKQAYEKAMAEIFQGIAESEGNAEALEKAMELHGAKVSITDFMADMFDTEGSLDMNRLTGITDKLVKLFGEEFDVETLMRDTEYAKNTGDVSYLTETLWNSLNAVNFELDEAQKAAIGGKLGAAWQAALDSGALDGTNFDVSGAENQLAALFSAIDLTSVGSEISAGVGEGMADYDYSSDASDTASSIESALRDPKALNSHSPARTMIPIGEDVAAGIAQGMSEYDFSTAAESAAGSLESAVETEFDGSGKSIGEDFADGVALGIKNKRSTIVQAAKDVAEAAVHTMETTLDIHSPSKVAQGIGENFGLGFEGGLRSSMERAVMTARQLTGEIVTAANISQSMRIANMPNLQQEIVSANSQTTTPVYLDGQQIASIQGYNNSMQLAWQNTRAAKGVGSR